MYLFIASISFVTVSSKVKHSYKFFSRKVNKSKELQDVSKTDQTNKNPFCLSKQAELLRMLSDKDMKKTLNQASCLEEV